LFYVFISICFPVIGLIVNTGTMHIRILLSLLSATTPIQESCSVQYARYLSMPQSTFRFQELKSFPLHYTMFLMARTPTIMSKG